MTMAEFWMERYSVVVAEKNVLGKKLKKTLEENKDLQQQLDKLKDRLTYSALKNMEMEISRLKEKLDAYDSEKKDLQQRLNRLTGFRSMNSDLTLKHNSLMHQAQELKMQLEVEKEENKSLHNVIDSFVDKCKELEDKAEGYKKERDEKIELLNAIQDKFTKAELEAKLEDMTQRCENITLSLRIVKERLDKSIADRSELQADRDIWFRKNGEKQVEIEELKKKIQSLEDDLEFKTLCRDGWRDRAEKAERQLEEKKQQSYANGYSDGNEEGQNELWEMLQNVRDMNLLKEFDPECEYLGDVIDMDLEDFKEAYCKWEAEQKKAAEEAKKQHVDYMRSYLKKFCVGKLCFGCPLYNTSEPVSSCLFSKLTDEEVEKKYSKVIDSECKKTPRYFTSAIEAVFTAEAKINKDMLKDICGIKDDKK